MWGSWGQGNTADLPALLEREQTSRSHPHTSHLRLRGMASPSMESGWVHATPCPLNTPCHVTISRWRRASAASEQHRRTELLGAEEIQGRIMRSDERGGAEWRGLLRGRSPKRILLCVALLPTEKGKPQTSSADARGFSDWQNPGPDPDPRLRLREGRGREQLRTEQKQMSSYRRHTCGTHRRRDIPRPRR